MLEYPENVTISSTGGAAEVRPNTLGLYRQSGNETFYGRPVWRSVERKDRVLIFTGKTFNMVSVHYLEWMRETSI